MGDPNGKQKRVKCKLFSQVIRATLAVMHCGKIAPSCPPPCDRKLICLLGFISLWGCISLLTFCLTSYFVIGDLSPPSGNHNSITVKIEVSSSFLLVLEYFLRTNCQFPLFMENTKKIFNRVTLFPFAILSNSLTGAGKMESKDLSAWWQQPH